MWDPFKEVSKTVLSNGISVYALHIPNANVEEVEVIVHSGSRDDAAGMEGLAHLHEHAIARKIDKACRFISIDGGKVKSGFTGFFCNYFGFTLPLNVGASITTRAFRQLSACIRAYTTKEDVEKEIPAIMNEFHHKNDLVWQCRQQAFRDLFHDTWLRYPNHLGSKGYLSIATHDDCNARQKEVLCGKNISIICIGGLSEEHVVRQIANTSLASLPSGYRFGLLPAREKIGKPLANRKFVKSSQAGTANPYPIGYFTKGLLPGTFGENAIEIYAKMLWEALFEKLRKKQAWIYDLHVNYYCYQDFSEVEIGFHSMNQRKPHILEGNTDRIIDGLKEKRLLFKETKRMLAGEARNTDYNCRLILDKLSYNLRQWQRNITANERIDAISSVKIGDIAAISECFTRDNRYTIIIS